MPELTHDLFVHLNRASQSVTDARTLLDLADTSDPVIASEIAQLKPRIAVVGEMVALAKPVAQLAAQHVETAHQASRDVTALGLLEPVSLTSDEVTRREDGTVRFVVSRRDPGHPNWLKTFGHDRGFLILRMVGVETHPLPTVRRVAAGELRELESSLPAPGAAPAR